MDSTSWQWVIVAVAVLASAVYVGVRLWRLLWPAGRDTACGGGCDGCESSARPLVVLQLPASRPPHADDRP